MIKQLTLKVCYKDITRRLKRNIETIQDVHAVGDLVEPGKGTNLLYSYVDVDRDEIDLITQDDVDTLVSDLPQLMQGATALKIYVRNPGEQRKWKDKFLRRAWVWNPESGRREKYASKSIGEKKLKSMSKRPKPKELDHHETAQPACSNLARKPCMRGILHAKHHHADDKCEVRHHLEHHKMEKKGKLWALKMAKMSFEEKREHVLKQAQLQKEKLEKELAEALAAIDAQTQKSVVPVIIGTNKKNHGQVKPASLETPDLDSEGATMKYGKRVIWAEVVRRIEYLRQYFPDQSQERLEKLSIKYVERQPSELIELFNAFLERVGEKPKTTK